MASQTDLMQALGFDRDDLNANRKGKFSAAQQTQMRDFLRGILQPILRMMEIATFLLTAILIGLFLIFGDGRGVRLVGGILSLFWVMGMSYGGYIAFSLTRIRGRVRVGEVTGTLSKRTDDEGRLWFEIGGAAFHVPTPSPERVESALQDGATYTAYFMGPPHAATLLSLEKKRA